MKHLYRKYDSYVHIGIILLLGIISYLNSFDVPLQMDDRSTIRVSISLNTDLYSVQGFLRKSRWFSDMTFAINRLLHGEQVFGYHLVNLLIHLTLACVIYIFVKRIIGTVRQTFNISEDDYYRFLKSFIPFTVAALFVCHPLQTQSITYISQRYTALATLLYVSSLLFYLQARLSLAFEINKKRAWLWGFVSILLAILAMKSKEIAFTLPLVAISLELAIFRGKLIKNSFFLVICTGLLLIIPLQLIYTQGSMTPENMLSQMQTVASETQSISRSDYLLTQIRVVATYLRLLILPINQNWDYDYPIYKSLFNPAVLASLLLHITMAVTAVVLFIRSQRLMTSGTSSSGISPRIASLGILWFYLALSVESSLIPIRDVIFEHRTYLPSVGFFMIAAAGFAGIAAYKRLYRNVLWGAILLLCFALTVSTISRNKVWSNEMVLWQDVLKKSPNKARASMAVGVLYFRKFQKENALSFFVRAVELEPGRDLHWMNMNSTIRVIDKFEGRCTDGMEYHDTAETVKPLYRKEWLAISSNNLGLAYEHLGNLNKAKENYQKALFFNPSLDLAWLNLALVSSWLNDTSTAETALINLRRINPMLEKDAIRIIQKQKSRLPQ